MDDRRLLRFQLDGIVEYALGFCPEYPGRVDWDDLLDRIEDAFDIDLGTDMLSADIKAIKKAVGRARKEAAE